MKKAQIVVFSLFSPLLFPIVGAKAATSNQDVLASTYEANVSLATQENGLAHKLISATPEMVRRGNCLGAARAVELASEWIGSANKHTAAAWIQNGKSVSADLSNLQAESTALTGDLMFALSNDIYGGGCARALTQMNASKAAASAGMPYDSSKMGRLASQASASLTQAVTDAQNGQCSFAQTSIAGFTRDVVWSKAIEHPPTSMDQVRAYRDMTRAIGEGMRNIYQVNQLCLRH